MIQAQSGKYTVYVSASAGSTLKDVNKKFQFSFDQSSGNFIRKVFNTNPRSVDKSDAGPATKYGLWLGETFENQIYSNAESFGSNGVINSSTTVSTNTYAAILPIKTYNDFLGTNPDTHAARTGWFFRQSKLQGSGSNDTSYSPSNTIACIINVPGIYITSGSKIV